ncbi:ATP-binding protein [Sphingomonas sp. BK580]|uniref:ATP-binding protein n=1 Tax=Sphingomonas sp. BK580 TaxID=2586972 RepID=UPI0017E0DD12|nr:ATP-binding protein [Sphingomonas sp. BK580]MBB3695505.1 signal transduction histidine kinase [Sphingomonas sp. BK580]
MSARVPRSIQARMLIVSAIATALALALAGAAMAGLLGRFVVEGLDQRLDAELTLLASAIDADGHVDRARLTRVRGALDAGPEWRWRVAGPDGTLGSADFPPLDPPPAAGPVAPPGPRPREGAEAVHARELVIASSRGDVTLSAAAPRSVVRRPIEGALWPLLGALAAVAAVLTAALLVQLRVGLAPLRRLRDQVAAIRGGARERVEEDQPAELRPLAAELNALAADNAATLAVARGAAANLAHALKTPVAALALDLRDRPEPLAQVERIDRTIRHHLARARAAAIDRRAATAMRPATEGLVAAVSALHRDARITLDVPADLAVAVDPQDLDELLGNLLDNAARHAAARVGLSAAREGRWVTVEVSDDGPGVPAAERDRVARPGTRLDERGDGHGFGLAIASELVALYGGALALEEASGGGLAVRLTLPSA